MSVQDPSAILAVDVEDLGETAAILRLTGEVDLSSAHLLADALRGMADRLDDVVIDATGVTFMDSTGLHALIDGKRAIDENGARIFLVPSPQVRRILELVFPDKLFAARLDSVAEAIEAMGAGSPT